MLKHFLSLIFIATLLSACSDQAPKAPTPQLVPKPTEMTVKEGSFTLNEHPHIYADPVAYDLATSFKEEAAAHLGIEFRLEKSEGLSSKLNGIHFRTSSDSTLGDEGYQMAISTNKIRISATHTAGFFYALQTLKQLLAPDPTASALSKGQLMLPLLEIRDVPAFQWRGMLLDCGRHFMEKEFVKRYIRLLAYHKMNRLHWHLTEDQGWRIEVKKYPKLTEIGAWRTEADGSRYGGFYTQEDIREIVAYAEAHHVTIVPEIDMPGHTKAVLAAYPEFACTEGPFEVANQWGVHKDVLCVGKEEVYEFVENVLEEVTGLFPGPYFHIGGDEAPKDRWKASAICQERIQKLGLKDEFELQAYFIQRVEQMLNARGKRLIGWDEILEGGLLDEKPDGSRSNATIQAWRNMDWAVEAAEKGNDAIVSPTSHCYLDYSVETTPLRQVYAFNPIPESLPAEAAHHILGGEVNVWTERIPQQRVDTMVFPRLLAISEVLWTGGEKDYEDFSKRVDRHYERLEAMGVNYGPEDRPAYLTARFDAAKRQYKVAVEAGMRGLSHRYTLDGSAPTASSMAYSDSIVLDKSATLKVQAFRKGKAYGEVTHQAFSFHKALGKSQQFTQKYSAKYPASGDGALVDGRFGSTKYRDGLWQAWEGEDMEIVIDLGENTAISKLGAGFLQETSSWILMPASVTFSLSTDNQNWQEVASLTTGVSPKESGTVVKRISQEISPTDARYVKALAKTVGQLPAWHMSAGGKVWIFVDEIIVE